MGVRKEKKGRFRRKFQDKGQVYKGREVKKPQDFWWKPLNICLIFTSLKSPQDLLFFNLMS